MDLSTITYIRIGLNKIIEVYVRLEPFMFLFFLNGNEFCDTLHGHVLDLDIMYKF